jgi:glycerophosphoryl diester phosphodiesterase
LGAASDRTAWLARWAYAHRGLHGPDRPENSLAAARAAIERGMGIECDVQLSADGQAMVFHDWELDRLTDKDGPTNRLDAARLAALPLAGSHETIPSLCDLLALVAGRVPLLIEVKSKRTIPVEPICRAVADALSTYRGEHAIMSFDPRVSRWFAARSPDTLRGLVVTQEHDKGWYGSLKRRIAFWWGRAEFIACDVRDLPNRFAASIRRRHIPVLTWTVRTAELAARARQWADAPIAEGEGVL